MTTLGPPSERNQDATVYVGNIDQQVDEALLRELFIQIGPVVSVNIPRDRVTQLHNTYGFVELKSEKDAEYAMSVLNNIKLYGKPIRVKKAAADKTAIEVGANVFVGNLDPTIVDEQMLYDTFRVFGAISGRPKIERDPETGKSKGYGFVSFNSFESSDAAIERMNNQWFGGRKIKVSYAIKPDTKGEKYGSKAERELASLVPNSSGGPSGKKGQQQQSSAFPVAQPIVNLQNQMM